MNFRTVLEGLYGALLAAGLIVLHPLLRRWLRRWGCTDAEAAMTLPGDEFATEVHLDATHAIAIECPPAEIWPWIVQIGADRGGFYSYDLLENLVGCRLASADRIVPEWQGCTVGDTVSLHPKVPGLPIRILEHERHFVLAQTWGFHLIPIDANATRLVVRARGDYEPRLKNALLNFLVWHVLYEPIHFVMERRMMLGIKRCAERTPARPRTEP